jgi:ATP-dependent DNA helicase RecG
MSAVQTNGESHQPQANTLGSFDSQPVQRMAVRDLDNESIQRHIREAVKRQRYAGPTDWQEFLLEQGGAVQDNHHLRPTVAGALAFAPRPERWLVASGIDVAEFSGSKPLSTNIRFQQPIRGNIFAVIERTVDLLWARIDHASTLDPEHGVTQVQTDAYPRVVLRELTVNALCHRDWSVEGSIIRIQIFPDRIEWISPGGLPPGIRVSELRDRQFSRNPMLAQFLYQAGVIERFGLGLDTVFDALQAADHPPPDLIDQGHTFIVRVFAKPVQYGAEAKRPNTTPVALTRRQEQILALLSDSEDHTTAELAQSIDESTWTVQRELNTLIECKLVISIGQARARRYRRADQ